VKVSTWGITGPELDNQLKREFHPLRLEAPTERPPRTGYEIHVGISRSVARPSEGQEEGPPEFVLTRHPALYDAEMWPRRVGTEPIRHVYRAMSEAEWRQARQRGFIQSDQRGTIADWEGTNAAVDPHSAISYLPRGQRGHVAKIRVEPEEKWFTIGADSYIRTRERVSLSRVERVVAVDKDLRGRLRFPGRELEAAG
jgi:hypothetical protein